MHSESLRNTWIICKHECFKRIRTRSFLVTTFLMPLFLAAVVGVPSVLGRRANHDNQNIVLVCPRPELGKDIREGIVNDTRGAYRVELSTDASDAEHQRLLADLKARRIDGFIWIDQQGIRDGNALYERRSARDFRWQQIIRNAVSAAFNRMRLEDYGIKPDQTNSVLRGAQLEMRLTGATSDAASRNAAAAIVTVLILATALFITLLTYGVMVMRSVLDEKASRVMEVLLCSATPDELMSGKILGVGAVGLIQVAIWGLMGIAIAAPRGAQPIPGFRIVPMSLIIYFAVFYLLGYLLYSAIFAAVGAVFNSTDDAQHWTFVVISPLIFACTLIAPVAGAPNSTLAIVTSLVPFCSPVLMYMRLAVESPPTWQIVLCFGFLIGAIYLVQRIAAQIYRVGILMYGKRPTVREVIRWLSYA